MTNIYVGNLSFRATENDIRNAFSRYGAVASVGIVMDRETGRSRGFAFVEMSNADEAKAAIEALDQQEIAGRRVSINEARPQTERPPRGAGAGGGGYRDNAGGSSGRSGDGGGGGSRGYGNSGGGNRYGEGGGGQRRGNYSRDREND